MPYAARTRVPISRTKTDIEDLLVKHGATGSPPLYHGRLPFKVCRHAGVAGCVSVLVRCSKQS